MGGTNFDCQQQLFLVLSYIFISVITAAGLQFFRSTCIQVWRSTRQGNLSTSPEHSKAASFPMNRYTVVLVSMPEWMMGNKPIGLQFCRHIKTSGVKAYRAMRVWCTTEMNGVGGL